MFNLTKLVNTLTPTLKKTLENAVGEALKRRSSTVEVEHWLYCTIFGKDQALLSFLENEHIDINSLQSELDRKMIYGSSKESIQPTISGSIRQLLERAWILSSVEYGAEKIFPEALLMATLQPDSFGVKGSYVEALRSVSTERLQENARQQAGRYHSNLNENSVYENQENILKKYATNLTQLARQEKLDNVLGRTEEISKTIDIFLRKRQNNPILLGHPGVGKTAVVEGIAKKIVSGEVPKSLKECELISLDMGLLQAGASMRGEFEERLTGIIDAVKEATKPVIIFIDEAHTIIGAGGSEGQNDAANLLKPALARGDFRTIGATTYSEYKKYFEKDAALSRRFQPVIIDEPSKEASVNILRAVSENLSKHHGVLIRDDAVKAAVDLTIRYMPSRRLPDKAISVMDTACSRVAISQHACPKEIELIREELQFAHAELRRVRQDTQSFGQRSTDTSLIESKINNLEKKLQNNLSVWEKEKQEIKAQLQYASENMVEKKDQTIAFPEKDNAALAYKNPKTKFIQPWVSEASISAVVSDWSGVPVNTLENTEVQRLFELSDSIKKRVIGQDFAIEAISKSLKVSRAGLTDPRKPIGVFLLCGPSGVGKTETALAIAEKFFGSEDALITVNMNEFKEPHKVSMLMGASAGYVGYGQGGILTEAVRQKPYSVLLLDEIEKAHPEIHDVFFQIFDKGNINDSEGNLIDFRNTIIIMASNAGSDEITQMVDDYPSQVDDQGINDQLKTHLLDYFSPAFLGRSEVIAYRPLSDNIGAKIVEIHLDRIKDRIEHQYKTNLKWDQKFVECVVRENKDKLSGGRAFESIINKKLLPKLAEECMKMVIEENCLKGVFISSSNDEIIVSTERGE